jgi:hypothetical protein
VTISAAPLVQLTISKTIPSVLGANDTPFPTFTFDVTGPGGYSSSPTVSFGQGDGGTLNPKTTTLTGLNPGTYNVAEETQSPYIAVPAHDVAITPNPAVGFSTCSAEDDISNNFGPASAQVKKVTLPAGSGSGWTFTLTGPGADDGVPPAGEDAVTAADNTYIGFNTELQEGDYVVTETAQLHWDNTGVGEGRNVVSDPAINAAVHTCTFSVNYPADADAVFSCVFQNTQRGHVTVLKTENGGVPTHAYTFELSGNGITPIDLTTDGTNLGSLDFGWQVPGTYTLCELAVGILTHSTLLDAPYNAAPYNSSQNSTTGDVCMTLPLAAGQTAAISVDNVIAPPGTARTIGYWKNWNTCAKAPAAKALKTGNTLMDTLLPVTEATGLHAFDVTNCTLGVSILSTSSSKYAEHQLGAQLLAALLNVKAGAAESGTTATTIAHAQALLGSINWNGSPTTTIIGNKDSRRNDFLTTASYLDGYNNNLYT